MILEKYFLICKNARDKIQLVIMELHQNGTSFEIHRITGQHFGKMTDQPEIIITQGKAKRSVLQQAQLEFNSKLKGYLDKGYKKLSDLTNIKFEDLDVIEMGKLISGSKTDQNGNIKPELAKSSNDCTVNIWKTPMYASRKLDGLRCLMTWNEDRCEVISISRGGENYDVSTEHIRHGEELTKFLKDNPTIILDGELYNHDKNLQWISGTGRLKTFENRCLELEYWVYDIADETANFEDRLTILNELEFSNNSKVKIVEHVLLNGWNEIKKYHDKWVLEGFEGLVARKFDKPYCPGKRNSNWIKVKDYKEDTFKIIDYSEGLRPEDFCFILETKSGKSFEAKPIGTRAEKEEYINNMEDIIGRLGEVKYFNLSDKGIPTQTVFRAVRYDII